MTNELGKRDVKVIKNRIESGGEKFFMRFVFRDAKQISNDVPVDDVVDFIAGRENPGFSLRNLRFTGKESGVRKLAYFSGEIYFPRLRRICGISTGNVFFS